uniref:Uncharacterized protein n=1 Tax=Oryza punctata TaxID=4537 RepID=A0A0E0M1B3_ORYPU
MAASAALNMAALCVLVLCSNGSQMMIAHASSTAKQDAAAGAMLRELVQNVVAEELGLSAAAGGGDRGNVGDACTAACQNCLILCAIKCVLKASPVACYADCITKDACFKAGEVVESTAIGTSTIDASTGRYVGVVEVDNAESRRCSAEPFSRKKTLMKRMQCRVTLPEEDVAVESSRTEALPKNLITRLPVQIHKWTEFQRPAHPNHSCA